MIDYEVFYFKTKFEQTNKCKTNKEIDQNFLATRISDQTDVSHNFELFFFGGGGYLSSIPVILKTVAQAGVSQSA